MGAWGIGLYASDFAQDLRSTVRAVARLPFAPDELLGHVREAEPQAADDPADPDHTAFWLVVADQFAKRGIDCASARDRALAIIDDGVDLAAMAARGMDEKSRAKRRAALADLRVRITAPLDAAARRGVLRAPQKFVLDAGDVIVYPTSDGSPINPYAAGKQWAWVLDWKQDGWGAFVVAERGHAFGFLAWYRPLVVCAQPAERPTLRDLLQPSILWRAPRAGTLTARHAANMQFASAGRVVLDPANVIAAFGPCTSSRSSAVDDISIANHLEARELAELRKTRTRELAVAALADLVVGA